MMIIILLANVLLSVGTPGIPGGAIASFAALATMAGLPAGVMGVYISINTLCDMGATCVNVIGDMAGCVVLKEKIEIENRTRIPESKEMSQMQISEKQNILTRTWVVAALACVCCILWGSAIPVIKTGYRILAVDSADTASQIVFAGIRFALAGILVLLFASFREKRVVLPDGKIFKYVIPVCFAQTFVQYFFFYIGVAHTSGVKGGIITGLGNFIAILMACLLVRNEKMTGRKLAGCILGFAGVVIINMAGGSMDMGFRLTGEGFVLIAQLSYGASTVLINIFSKKYHRLF